MIVAVFMGMAVFIDDGCIVIGTVFMIEAVL